MAEVAAPVYLDDSTLIDQAQHDRQAFDELVARHALPAWRLAQAIALGPADAAHAVAEAVVRTLAVSQRGIGGARVALRTRLLSSTRAAALERAEQRVDDNPAAPDWLGDSGLAGRADPDRAALTAFHEMPEPWRAALWLVDVEAVPEPMAAAVLEVPPPAVAPLAARARAGFRERRLRAQVTATAGRSCLRTTARLSAYVAGSLGERDDALVRDHLSACQGCSAAFRDARDIVGCLRSLVQPAPAELGELVWRRWVAARAAPRGPLGLVLPGGRTLPAWAERAMAGAAAVLVTLGIAGAVTLGARAARDGEAVRPAGALAEPAPRPAPSAPGGGDFPPLDLGPVGVAPALPPMPGMGPLGAAPWVAAPVQAGALAWPAPPPRPRIGRSGVPVPAAPPPAATPPPRSPAHPALPLPSPPDQHPHDDKPPSSPPPSVPRAQVDVGVAGLGGISLGDGCTNVELAGSKLLGECGPSERGSSERGSSERGSSALSVEVGGSALPGLSLGG